MKTSCSCGCGATPRKKTSKYLRGHNRRGIISKGWIEGGYRFICVDGRKIAEHRHVVETREGRRLTRDEVVHHVDADPFNNEPENLVVLSRAEHMRLHAHQPRRRWTPEETSRARQLRAAGLTIQQVAA